MKDTPLAQARDSATIASARMLCTALDAGLPCGETRESVAEFLDVHSKALEDMQMRVGRGSLMISLEFLSRQYPLVPVKVICCAEK